jgi:polyisoprenoid-binding protein YceI
LKALHVLTAACALAAASALAGAPPVPTVIPHGTLDYRKADAGTYRLDPNHTAVLAHVSHAGFSISLFRFGKSEATLQWNPDDFGKCKLEAKVETVSIATPVAGFARQLAGKDYLKSAQFPEATFVSTAFHQTDATHGTVDGNFTLMGVTKQVTFKVTLIGAGPGFAGGPIMGHVIGIHAETAIDPQDYGISPLIPSPISVDTEFDKPDSKRG